MMPLYPWCACRRYKISGRNPSIEIEPRVLKSSRFRRVSSRWRPLSRLPNLLLVVNGINLHIFWRKKSFVRWRIRIVTWYLSFNFAASRSFQLYWESRALKGIYHPPQVGTMAKASTWVYIHYDLEQRIGRLGLRSNGTSNLHRNQTL